MRILALDGALGGFSVAFLDGETLISEASGQPGRPGVGTRAHRSGAGAGGERAGGDRPLRGRDRTGVVHRGADRGQLREGAGAGTRTAARRDLVVRHPHPGRRGSPGADRRLRAPRDRLGPARRRDVDEQRLGAAGRGDRDAARRPRDRSSHAGGEYGGRAFRRRRTPDRRASAVPFAPSIPPPPWRDWRCTRRRAPSPHAVAPDYGELPAVTVRATT